jgi:hypothetical protein
VTDHKSAPVARVDLPAARLNRRALNNFILDKVEEAVTWAWHDAWKHRDDKPSEETARAVREFMAGRVSGVIYELLDFETDADD